MEMLLGALIGAVTALLVVCGFEWNIARARRKYRAERNRLMNGGK